MNRIWGWALAAALLLVCWAAVPLVWAGGPEDKAAAVRALNDRDWDRAIELFTKAIDSGELHPYHLVRAYTGRGRAYLAGKKDVDRALADYNQAIEINPDYSRAYFERAGAWAEKGEWDKAVQDATRALELEPKVDEYKKMLELIHRMAE